MVPAWMMPERPIPQRPILHSAPEPDAKSVIYLKGKRAVIVEDEGITQLQLRRILRSAGMEVVGLAGNGQEGIRVVLEKKPDDVLMDIRMPVMDGMEAARRILCKYNVCIVALTAFSDEEHWQEAQEIGMCGYVIKPV